MLADAIKSVRKNFALVHVDNGEQLMDYLSRCNGNSPHLIFLDLNMPKKNGLACLEEIRANPIFKDTAVAVYSASSSDDDIESAFVAGANIFITKPNSFEALQKIVADTLSINWQYHTNYLSMDNFMMVR